MLNRTHDAPDLWSVLSLVADDVDSKASEQQVQLIDQTLRSLDIKLTKTLSKFNLELLQESKNQKTYIKRFEAAATSIFSNIKIDLNSLSMKINKTDNKLAQVAKSSIQAFNISNASSPNIIHQDHTQDIAGLKQDLQNLNGQLSSMVSKTDEQAIQFGGLGFKSFAESASWFETNATSDMFGLIVDFHGVMEHVYFGLTRVNSADKLLKAKKNELSNIGQQISISSFETEMPKFMQEALNSVVNEVIGNDNSYFSGIKSFHNWNLSHVGMKAKLELHLEKFREAQTTKIDNYWGRNINSPMYYLANKSFTESCAWVMSLVRFIEKTYKDYVRAKFSTAKAWHITTRLASKNHY